MIYWLLFVFLDKLNIFDMDLLNYFYLIIVTRYWVGNKFCITHIFGKFSTAIPYLLVDKLVYTQILTTTKVNCCLYSVTCMPCPNMITFIGVWWNFYLFAEKLHLICKNALITISPHLLSCWCVTSPTIQKCSPQLPRIKLQLWLSFIFLSFITPLPIK